MKHFTMKQEEQQKQQQKYQGVKPKLRKHQNIEATGSEGQNREVEELTTSLWALYEGGFIPT